MSTVIIACDMLRQELESVMEEIRCSYQVLWVEAGLHDKPTHLNRELRLKIDMVSEFADTILLAYGFCGGALAGLSSQKARLVLPLFHDCIHLLTAVDGSRTRKDSDCLYFTSAWIKSDKFICKEYERHAALIGRKKALRAYRSMLRGYQAMKFIDTGHGGQDKAMAAIHPLAELLGLRMEIANGSALPLKEMITENWEQYFYVAEPGEALSLSIFLEKTAQLCQHEGLANETESNRDCTTTPTEQVIKGANHE